MQYNTIQYNCGENETSIALIGQCNQIERNTIQYDIIQYNIIQYNTIQHNTIQCNIISTLNDQAEVFDQKKKKNPKNHTNIELKTVFF